MAISSSLQHKLLELTNATVALSFCCLFVIESKGRGQDPVWQRTATDVLF